LIVYLSFVIISLKLNKLDEKSLGRFVKFMIDEDVFVHIRHIKNDVQEFQRLINEETGQSMRKDDKE
jgi:hypothetical protein